MSDYRIRDKCFVNTNLDSDVFVGLKSDLNGISVHFPLGFRISNDDRALRKDILMLISAIDKTTSKKESEILRGKGNYNVTAFPFQAYLLIIYDFLSRGYYKEREIAYTTAKQGKINWRRTIKSQKPYVQGNSVFYLDLIVKKSKTNDNELITLIHEYFVFESFSKVGWLFTSLMPCQPRIKYSEKLFRGVLTDKIVHTFNDRNRQLFRSMLAIVDYQGEKDAPTQYQYGTYRFEYVWEAMIDRVYGITDKERYFPKTTWKVNRKRHDNACLEPDTIMVWNGNVYVLDAKYYKYGYTLHVNDLPESTSINKQITYGEYIAENQKFRELHGENMVVYNAFLMPYDSQNPIWDPNNGLTIIGEAESSWKDNSQEYHRIQGILVDVKHIMSIALKQDIVEIQKLAGMIETSVSKC